MGAISDFVAAFARDYDKYLSIEKEVRALCEEALRGIQFLLQSRVKAVESLEKKLRDRSGNYKGESENVADIVDLVAGRIILADWRDFERVEATIKHIFILRGRIQHPKPGQKSVSSQSRFRGYGGRHFHVTRASAADHSCNPVIEIQVMTAYMWAYATLAHDIEYKKLHGEPSEDLVLSLEVLKGIANLGEIGLDMFNRHFLPAARLSPQESDVGLNLPSAIQTVGASVCLDDNDKWCIRDLRLTDPRHDKERIVTSKDQLLEGSCSWVLEDPAFVDWWTRDDSRLLWIHGDPGKGKTMMMIALISEVSKRLSDRPGSNVLAYFFCQNTSGDLNTTVSVLRGLIYLLVDQEKKLVRHLRRYYDSAGSQLFEGQNATYALRVILSDILKDQSLGNVFLMIDALDECDSKIHELLDWIICEEPEISPKIKWLTTSRNEPAFTERFGRDRQLHTSLELNSLHVARAVENFIDYKVKGLADLKSYDSKLQAFVRKSLHEKAEDTFLWVALVCKELSKVRQQKVRSLLAKIPAGLIPLYERMLRQVLDQEDQNDVVLSRRILCSITLALRPLRMKEIAVFAEIPNDEDVEELVGLCGSFLTIREETVYLVHQSAKDYLENRERKEIFLLGQEHEHANTACLCLRIMSNILRKDICKLQTPGFRLRDVEQGRIGANIPLYAQYACLYWANHLQQAGSTKQETLTLGEDCQVLGFFQKHFLHWLEALTLMSKLSEAVLAIRSLGSMQKVYISALVFSPKTSIIKRLFLHELPNWIERLPSVEEAWSTSLQTLESHSPLITELIFSPDGQLLVSAYDEDAAFRVWDTSTGALRGTLEDVLESDYEIYEDTYGHFNTEVKRVNAMVFFSNSQLLTSASSNQGVRIWNPITQTSQDIFEDGSDQVTAFAFSSDARFVASTSTDTFTIRLWDPLIGTAQGILEGHSDLVNVMTFAPPSGQLLASGSDDTTIRLWDSSTCAPRYTLRGHSGSIRALVFSPPNGQLLASVADSDSTISLWDTSIGVLKSTTQGRSDNISSILFSPNGQLLVSRSNDRVMFWDSSTGASKGILEGIPNMQALSFSPDGRLLAVSSQKTVQLWDPITRDLHATLEGHSGVIRAIQFSPDGHLLATGSCDETVRLWDVVTNASQGELDGHSGDIVVIALSPCGRLYATGSRDTTVRLWDSGTSRYILAHISDCHSYPTAMAFSPNSQLLATGYSDGIIRLWDPATGVSRFALERHTARINAVAFSADGQILASGSKDTTISLWDPATGASRGTLKGHSKSVSTQALAFSTDSQTLASVCGNPHFDMDIRFWDVKTCVVQLTLDRTAQAVRFAQNGQRIGPDAEDIVAFIVWDTKKGTLIYQDSINDGQEKVYLNQERPHLDISDRLVQISSYLDDFGHEKVWNASCAMDTRKEWVTYKGRNVLRIPLARRPSKYAIHKNILVMGDESGRITDFQFMNTAAPPCI